MRCDRVDSGSIESAAGLLLPKSAPRWQPVANGVICQQSLGRDSYNAHANRHSSPPMQPPRPAGSSKCPSHLRGRTE